MINAHESEIANMTLNSDGTILATASDKGTIIRLFRADDGTFIHEVRRGSKNSEIYSICFSANSNFLACSSDRGTIHIFSLVSVKQKLDSSSSVIDVKEKSEEISKGDSGKENKDPPKNPKSL